MLISLAFLRLEFLMNGIKLLVDISKDCKAYFTLSSLDFTETKDSNACAIASKPAEDLTLLGAEIKNSGNKKKISGINKSLSNEYLILFT